MRKLFSNAFWLLLSQFGGLLIPLIELPLLARRLEATEYGMVVYVLAISIMSSVIIEYGFNFSAVKKIAGKKNRKFVSQISTDIFLAKLILSIIPVIVAFFIIYVVPSNIKIPLSWFFWIVLFILSFGFTPLWYYISTEEVAFPAVLDLLLRVAGLVLIIFFVNSPSDAQLTIVIQSLVGVLSTSIPTFVLFYRIGFGSFSIKRSLNEIKTGFSVFLYKSSQGVMVTMSSSLLGLLGGSKSVSYFMPSEKIIKVITTLMTVMLNLAYPVFLNLVNDESRRPEIKKMIIKMVISIFALSVVFSSVVFVFSSKIIDFVFGPDYDGAAHFIKMMVWIIPFRVSILSLTILWFMPMNKEKLVTNITFSNILFILTTAYFCITNFGAIGITISLMLSELMTFLILVYFFIKKDTCEKL